MKVFAKVLIPNNFFRIEKKDINKKTFFIYSIVESPTHHNFCTQPEGIKNRNQGLQDYLGRDGAVMKNIHKHIGVYIIQNTIVLGREREDNRNTQYIPLYTKRRKVSKFGKYRLT